MEFFLFASQLKKGFPKRLNRGGFSLMEVMVALGLASFVTIGALTLVSEYQKINNLTSFQLDLNSAHNQQVIKTRNPDWLRQKMGSLANNPCMGKSGTGCGALNVSNAPLDDFIPATNLFRTTMTYSLVCGAERCDRLVIRIVTDRYTEAIAKGFTAKPLQTTVAILPFLLADRRSLDFNCISATSFSRKIDFYSLRVRCGPVDPVLPSPVCDTGGVKVPMLSYTNPAGVSCETALTNIDCSGSYGIRSLSAMGGNCAGVTPPTWTPPAPVCGPANGQTFLCAPAGGFCDVGSPTPLSGSGPWSWSCSVPGGGSTPCQANLGVPGCIPGCVPGCSPICGPP